MTKSFLATINETLTTGSLLDIPSQPTPRRIPVRILVISIPEGVTNTIHSLHSLGFADVSQWSPYIRAYKPGEVMSILTRYLIVNS
jgi:hypothetical protein